MSSARELLEQADALMRRNRRPPGGEDIPELTDAVADEALARSTRPRADIVRRAEPLPATTDDIPELTEAVEEIEAPSIQEYPEDPDELSRWLQEDDPKIARAERSRDPIAESPAPRRLSGHAEAVNAGLRAEALAPQKFLAPIDEPIPAESPMPPSAKAMAAEVVPAAVVAPEVLPPEEIFVDDVPAPAPAEADEVLADDDVLATASPHDGVAAIPGAADDPERWKALAEEIRMQVLQRIDIFTDTGLREQLTARLQPVVDRASADLVATINREVGQLLRAYIAEAIEREIEHWRHGGG
jgi:hypothetical protein